MFGLLHEMAKWIYVKVWCCIDGLKTRRAYIAVAQCRITSVLVKGLVRFHTTRVYCHILYGFMLT